MCVQFRIEIEVGFAQTADCSGRNIHTCMYMAFFLFFLSKVPVINNLPNSTSIQEGLDTEIQLYVIDVTDDDGDSLTCDLGPGTTPGSGKTDFRIKIVSGTSSK